MRAPIVIPKPQITMGLGVAARKGLVPQHEGNDQTPLTRIGKRGGMQF
jgi:hypothetical protein